MRGFGQIAELCAFARPDVGVITNVGPVHLEQVGDLAGVARAKGELIEALPGRRDRRRPRTTSRSRATTSRSFGSERTSSVRPAGAADALRTARGRLHGAAPRPNALTALATANALGLATPERLDVEFTEWRNQELPLPGGGVLINDAWNANPVSMRAGLEHLVALAAGRRTIAVLGDMAELGDYSAEGHAEVGAPAELARRGSRDRPASVAYGGHHVDTVEEALALLE